VSRSGRAVAETSTDDRLDLARIEAGTIEQRNGSPSTARSLVDAGRRLRFAFPLRARVCAFPSQVARVSAEGSRDRRRFDGS
jgi:hypothetical protein